MFDNTLTSLLQLVIVVDLLGAATYFVLAGMRQHRRRMARPEPSAETLVVPMRQPFWTRLWGRQPELVLANEGDYGQLRRILDGFRDGLR
ncbi:MAG: hypothetical protein WDA75_19020 [Candidatus Latescibacterota bacterium]|jgi:hypothetical protein